MEYVEREEAIHAVIKRFWSKLYISDVELGNAIEELPAADVVPGAVYRQTVETLEKIREEANMRYEQAVEAEEALAYVVERKRGEWVSRTVDREVTSYIKTECGNCNFEGELWYNFCPHCGADMRPQDDLELLYVPSEDED